MEGYRSRKWALVVLPFFLFLTVPVCGCRRSAPEPVKATVPALGGMGVEDARGALLEEELAIGSLSEEYSETVPPGLVIRTLPPEGETVEPGTAVDLVVSRGPEPVSLPDLRGKPEGEAVALLKNLGLQPNMQQAYNESVPVGLVCASDPPPGTSLVKGSVVTLTVSLGSAYVTCPVCGGKGTVTVSETCPECGGSGVCYT